MQKKKIWAVVLSLVLLASVTIGVTLATGDADTPETDPNFTVGLGSASSSYRIIPGKTETLSLSNIAVTTDRDAWLFAAISDQTTVAGVSYISYEITEDWQPLLRNGVQVELEDGSPVYYRAVSAGNLGEARYYPLFNGNEILYPATLENEDLEGIPSEGLMLKIWTQSTQQLGFPNALAAYDGDFTAPSHQITWKDENGEILAVTTVQHGTMPSYSGVLQKAPDSTNHYSFSGWTPTPVEATQDAEYTAVYTGEAHSYGAWSVTTPPTCEGEGTKTRLCACGWAETQPVSATGHSYGTPTYLWTETADGWSCTATAVCENDSSHVLEESAAGAYSVQQEPTKFDLGVGVYTATFQSQVFTLQQKAVDIPTLPHTFVTVYVVDETNGSGMNIWAWGGNGARQNAAAFPGQAMPFEGTAVSFVNDNTNTAVLGTFPLYKLENFDIDAYDEGLVLSNGVKQSGNVTGYAETLNGRDYLVFYVTDGGTNLSGFAGSDVWTAENAVVEAPTCEAPGTITYTGLLTEAERVVGNGAALGHSWGAVTYAWTDDHLSCTATVVCQRDSSHEETETVTAAVTEEAPVGAAPGTRTYTASFTNPLFTEQIFEEEIPPVLDKFETVFPNTEDYLYRVGNGNTVKLSSLFRLKDGMTVEDGTKVEITVEKADAQTTVALGSYTKNAAWGNATLKFTGEGPVRVTIQEMDGANAVSLPYTLNLEVVTANNATANTSASSANIVLLNDVNGGLNVNSSKRLYGNGFVVNDTRNNPSGAGGYVTLANAIVDNAQFVGYEPETAVTDGVNNPGYAPAVTVSPTNGSTELYNTYISGGRNALLIEGGKLYMNNCVLDGGAIANMELSSGALTMENCKTTTSTRGGLHGLSIRVTGTSGATVELKGSFEQHNWLQKSEIPSTYSSVFTSLYNGEYAYNYNGSSYVNMGVMFLSGAGSIYQADAAANINDLTSNVYGYIEKSLLGYTGTVYTAKGVMGSPEMLEGAAFEPYQYGVLPNTAFDFTNKNYIAQQDGSDTYCYYDSTAGRVNISFEKNASNPYFEWDPAILTVTKYGNTVAVSDSLVSGSAEKVNGKYRFANDGDYVIRFTYTDPFNYDQDLVKGNKTYTKELKIHVISSASVHPQFVYVSSWANAAKKVKVGNNNYVMPDVSGTSTYIGSTTVSGTTIYFPIVDVPATDSSGNNAYSSGKGYYFAPVFNALNITDYNQSTGAQQYSYTASSTTWPHGNSATTGPNADVFGYAAGAAYANQPYGRSMNAQYYKYARNNKGLCYTSNDIEKDNAASTHLVQYHYVANDGLTYIFYIQYKFGAMTYKSSSCLATGTLITLADGTQKPIEELSFGDRLRTWDFFTGESSEEAVALLLFHGNSLQEVETLRFSDGTELRLIGDHGVFDYDENKFVYPVRSNCSQYVGHLFVKPGKDGYELVTLVDVSFTTEYTGSWSLTSAHDSNAVASGLLTAPPPQDFYNWIGMSGKLQYDVDAFLADVETYGLYDYSVFEGYVTEAQFDAFNGAYLKIPVEKGCFSFGYILDLIAQYGSYMNREPEQRSRTADAVVLLPQ